MTERQRGLGRGLAALMGDAATEPAPVTGEATAAGVRMSPIEDVRPNKDQPRKIFAQADLDELAASIRERGVLQPILVRPHPQDASAFEIIAGERRWRAAQQARLTQVPIIIRPMDDLEVLEVAIVENVQRADLNPLEEAEAYKALMDRFGRTQDQIAGVVGKSRSHVANTLRLLQLPPGVLEHLKSGALSAGHVRALITATDPEALAEEAVRQGLNVRQTEALARRGAAPSPKSNDRPARPSRGGKADVAALEQDLADALGLKVQLADRGGRGELTLRYANLEQLDDLCRRLMRG